MTKSEYDDLFRLLCKLQYEAPCMNGGCPNHQVCDYGNSGIYGEECAIDIVREVAESRYYSLCQKSSIKVQTRKGEKHGIESVAERDL